MKRIRHHALLAATAMLFLGGIASATAAQNPSTLQVFRYPNGLAP